MSLLSGTTTRGETVNATSTDEHVDSDQAREELAPEAAAPVGGRHRAEGKAAKAPREPKAPSRAKSVEPAEPVAHSSESEATAAPALSRTRFGSARARLRVIALPVVAVVTVACFAGAIILAVSNRAPHQTRPLNTDAKAALAAANHDVKDILSYDYRQIDSNISTAKAEISGQLLSDYTATAQKLIKQAVPIKAIVTATVSAQSVVQAQSGRVTVLIYVDQESVKQLAGAKTPTTRIDPLRVQMTMTKVNGRWMASDLQPV